MSPPFFWGLSYSKFRPSSLLSFYLYEKYFLISLIINTSLHHRELLVPKVFNTIDMIFLIRTRTMDKKSCLNFREIKFKQRLKRSELIRDESSQDVAKSVHHITMS